jgi:bifunctional non-homologous end joining protein LigD
MVDELTRPMLAVAGRLPDGSGDWATEMKWDGVRVIADLRSSAVRLISRNGRDVTASYPEAQSLADAVGEGAVLDGEIVAMDDAGRPDFERLQSRMHVTDRARVRVLRTAVPVHYLLFDVLMLGGHRLLHVPYARRRELLERLEVRGEWLAVPPAFRGEPIDAFRASLHAGLEGVVCKRLDSLYTPGRRSSSWVKVKHQRTQEVVIVGWEPGVGRRAGEIGALLLGVHVNGVLQYVGQVGTGFSDRALVDLRDRLSSLQVAEPAVAGVPRSHARLAQWVRPTLVGEVAYGQWTHEARLRHPTWKGLRPDKAAADVIREEP